eukprot:11880954-Karenia_brevis.AAC.1
MRRSARHHAKSAAANADLLSGVRRLLAALEHVPLQSKDALPGAGVVKDAVSDLSLIHISEPTRH